ncbi:MAG: glycosyltransferase family 2 protein [Thaumarchaeota archaeon]|nr:glycosyltransferase family 2 protein [Nitrososphaerota archaeon]
MGKYFAIVTCRNSELIIEQSLFSLKNQTLKPEYVIVIDDGSTDKTAEILKKIKNDWDDLHIITNPDLGYDIGRVVNNWNKALKLVSDKNLKKTDYHMISADDDVYEENYAKKIVTYMDADPKLAIVSGIFNDGKFQDPTGGGRFVRNSFFISKYRYYPERMGYESAVLYIALRDGYKHDVLREARFRHIREIGSEHHFYEFGAGMRTLGYNPLFVFGRFFANFVRGKPVSRRGSLNMLYYYLTFSPTKSGYNSMYDKGIRDYIRKVQTERIKKIFRKI